MSNGAVAGVAVGGPLAVILFVVVILGGGSTSQAASDATLTAGLQPGAPLDAAAVPNPAWVRWIEAAGALCPTFPAPVIAAQIDAESGWDPTAVSPTGAEGLAQFEPGTWPAYSADDAGDGNISPFNPPDAIMSQGRYDCALAQAVAVVARSSGQSILTLALDAYNAGLAAVLAAGGVPPIAETEAYAPRIEALAAQYTAPATLVAATGNAFGGAEVAAATGQIGRPYVWGGGDPLGPSGSAVAPPGLAGEAGFDCSGLVLYAVFQATAGQIQLPHSSEDMATMGAQVATGPGSQVLGSGVLQPGDDIAFQLSPGDYDHIGIYVGNGDMVAAPQTGDTVDIENLNTPYWLNVPWSVRRFG